VLIDLGCPGTLACLASLVVCRLPRVFPARKAYPDAVLVYQLSFWLLLFVQPFDLVLDEHYGAQVDVLLSDSDSEYSEHSVGEAGAQRDPSFGKSFLRKPVKQLHSVR